MINYNKRDDCADQSKSENEESESEEISFDHKRVKVSFSRGSVKTRENKKLRLATPNDNVKAEIVDKDSNEKAVRSYKVFIEEPQKCRFCRKVFRQKHLLVKHEETHRRFKCSYCGENFSQSSNLKRHIRMLHEGVSARAQTKISNCQKCDAVILNEDHLAWHMETHKTSHINTELTCDICEQSYRTELGLERHQHFDKTCQDCGKFLKNKDELKHHVMRHKGEKHFECSLCNKKFARANHLNYHLQKDPHVHQNPEKY